MAKLYYRIVFIIFCSFLFTMAYQSSYYKSTKLQSEMDLPTTQEVAASVLEEEAPVDKGQIPRVFWTYWHSSQIPDFLQECINSWMRFNPSFKLVILTLDTLDARIGIRVPKNFEKISKQYQADWIRLAVLMKHGGVWVDSSFIMTTSILPVLDKQEKENTEGIQFFMDRFTTVPYRPYFENWFIAAVPHARYITHWILEFTRCIEEFAMTDLYLDDLKNTYGEKIYAGLVQASNSPSYLKQHICLQKVILVDEIPQPSGISALRPPYGPFYLFRRFGWNSWEFAKQLVQEWNPWHLGNPPHFIKLTSHERNLMRIHTKEGFDWLSDMGLWLSWGKRHFQTSRLSFYCSFVGACNRTTLPSLPEGFKPTNFISSYHLS